MNENIKLEINPYIDIKIPKLIFIVPYRDREQHQLFFNRQMDYVLEDIGKENYEIYFAHQCDKRDFNRGAMKNLGFIAMKEKYADNYKDITFIFNDVDTMPYTKNFLNYETTHGNVKHFYGFTYTLGGIVSIKGCDFEKVNGFPNFWAWGYEDNMFQDRVLKNGLKIDRSQFYPIMDKNILQNKDGLDRIVNRKEYDRFAGNTTDGICTIQNIVYEIDNRYINITNFKTLVENDKNSNNKHDLRNKTPNFGYNHRMKMVL